VLRVNDFFGGFVWRNRSRDENYLLQVKSLPDLLRSPEMPQMDGIERPAE
jgi:hypothetical protein